MITSAKLADLANRMDTEADSEIGLALRDAAWTIDWLHEVLAYEAGVAQAQCDFGAIKGSRRAIIDRMIRRMRIAALGGTGDYSHAHHGTPRGAVMRIRAEDRPAVEIVRQEHEARAAAARASAVRRQEVSGR